ncbi:hypothetical protein [Leifsonia sp. EB34]|uniref:hypothetical protein n=1 Tax=Leifsonia sp. EB34 TaxID=3156303 RepID=UPI003514D2BF
MLDDLELVTSAVALDEWDGLVWAYPRIVAVGAARGFSHVGPNYHIVRMRALGIIG